MSEVFKDLKVGLDDDLSEKLAYLVPHYSQFRILRKSIDARRRHDIHEVVSVEVFGPNESPRDDDYAIEPIAYSGPRPIVVGTGPAGLFAALRLVERGIPCLILERGSEASKRILGINQYWRYGRLDPNNNVCFGEGGAGLYSDGKLITRIKSPYIPYVLHRLVKFGAPAEIQYLSNPHVGSDRIRRVIPKLRQFLLDHGCEIKFETRVVDFMTAGSRVTGVKTQNGESYSSDHIILATGHSANDIFDRLHERGVTMEGKSFAVGLRIEHPQKMVDHIQYRQHADHPKLHASNYKLTHHDPASGVGVYSFCMCPGGYVLSSGTETDGYVCNGMSNYHRNSPFANAAIVVSVDYATHFGQDLFAGLRFRTQLEQDAFAHAKQSGGTRELPAQKVTDFMKGQKGDVLPTSSPSGVVPTRLDEVLPDFLVERIREGLENFNSKMPGFIGPEGQLHGVESRTSCPLRITRHDVTLESVSHAGLYPAGEGAGYAGGITSAAVDGIRIAESIVERVRSQPTQTLSERHT